MGADVFDTAEADALVSANPYVHHVPSPSERVFLELGRDKCQIQAAKREFLTGPRPYEATTKAGPSGSAFLFSLRSGFCPGGLPQGSILLVHALASNNILG